MAVRSLAPNLMVTNVNATVDYYKQFGFELIQSVPPEGNFDWAMVGADGVILMFQQESNLKTEYPDLQNQSPGGGLTILIEVTDIQALYDQLKTHATLVKELHKTFYGADEFAICDPNGFILTFHRLPVNQPHTILTTSDISSRLVTLLRAGQFIDAQTELMDSNCLQIEPAHAVTPSVSGLSAILEKEKAFQAAVVEMHSITISEPVVAGNFFSLSLHFDLTLHKRGRVQLAEIGLYEVKDGKIVREQFFY